MECRRKSEGCRVWKESIDFAGKSILSENLLLNVECVARGFGGVTSVESVG